VFVVKAETDKGPSRETDDRQGRCPGHEKGSLDCLGPLDEEASFFQTEGASPFAKEKPDLGPKEEKIWRNEICRSIQELTQARRNIS